MCPLEVIPKITLPIKFLAIKARHSKTGRSCRVGRVNRVAGQTGHRSKTSHFKRVKNEFGSIGCGSGQVDPYFSHEFFYILYIYIYIYYFFL